MEEKVIRVREVLKSHKINLLYKQWLSIDTFQDILTENKEIKQENKEIKDILAAVNKRLDSIENSKK